MTRKVLKSLKLLSTLLVAISVVMVPTHAYSASRIKDIVYFEGVRENLLVGYGLVVGLDGTGDTLQNAPFTQQSIVAMLERMGVNTRDESMRTKNMAAVMVTATLPAFARQGTKIDIVVSAMADAQDLSGGTLVVTPLVGADGEVYAVGQGPLAVGGFVVTADGQEIKQGVPTSGRISNGAIVEREVEFDLGSLNQIHLSLKNPDFTTSRRIAQAINAQLDFPSAKALDPATVLLTRPLGDRRPIIELMTDIEQISVIPDQPARVVVNESSGIIVMGSNVKINTIAIAQGSLTIKITETPQVSQPTPFSEGETVTVPSSTIEIDSGEGSQLGIIESGVTLQDLVNSLNALGIGPRDMISILQAIKAAGALQADIEVM